MSPNGSNPHRLYRVSSSGNINDEVRELIELSISLGIKNDFLQSLRKITLRLQTAPFEFGECRYRLPFKNVHCCIGAIQPVAVQFAIREESRDVMILKVILLSK
jgi:hypothetical protein